MVGYWENGLLDIVLSLINYKRLFSNLTLLLMTALRQEEEVFVRWKNKEKQKNEETAQFQIDLEGDRRSSGQTETSKSDPRIITCLTERCQDHRT